VIRHLEVKDFPPPINYCQHQIMRLVRAGKFPPPIRIGRRKAWPEPVIQEFIASLPVTAKSLQNRPVFTSEEARAAVNVRWAKYRAQKQAEREAEATA
jgi:hypothetical protein